MPVYLIRAGEHGPVKIGCAHSLVDAFSRINNLQVSHWETLRLVRLWAGEEAEERQLHLRFADNRIRGEWFSFSRLMLADVGLKELDISHLTREGDSPLRVIDVVTRMGGAGEVARACRTNRGAVSWWIKSNEIPKKAWSAIVACAANIGATEITEGVLSRMTPSGVTKPSRRWWAA